MSTSPTSSPVSAFSSLSYPSPHSKLSAARHATSNRPRQPSPPAVAGHVHQPYLLARRATPLATDLANLVLLSVDLFSLLSVLHFTTMLIFSFASPTTLLETKLVERSARPRARPLVCRNAPCRREARRPTSATPMKIVGTMGRAEIYVNSGTWRCWAD
ncbi:hypothetical protein DFH09DRAFT_1328359 [Mycena vulgaris]|nr:hypothetical protein DFH09DRAFT_1328359 [Mycena vulgaris]